MSTQEIFSKNLREELIARHISQRAVATALEIAPQTVSEWCNGICMPSLDTFRKLCVYLHADADILLDLEDEDIKIPEFYYKHFFN